MWFINETPLKKIYLSTVILCNNRSLNNSESCMRNLHQRANDFRFCGQGKNSSGSLIG